MMLFMKPNHHGLERPHPIARTILAHGLLCLLLLVPWAGNAAQNGDFTYDIGESTISITGYIGPGGAVAVPATIDGMPVTGIGIGTFTWQTRLTDVTLPDSVINIGAAAFSGCNGLTTLILPNSVTSIGDQAFLFCTRLTNVTLSSALTNIGPEAFAFCSALTSITLPNSVASIGTWTFHGCASLTNIAVDALNPTYSDMHGVLLTKDQSALIQ